MFKCFYCGSELCWDSDVNLSDIGFSYIGFSEDEFGIVSFYHCPHCGRNYEI